MYCKKCGQIFNESAEKCPACGTLVSVNEMTDTVSNSRKDPFLKFISACIILLIAGTAAHYFFPDAIPDFNRSTSDSGNKSEQYELIADAVVTSKLSDLYGSTAQYFRGYDVKVNRTYKTSDGVKITGSYDIELYTSGSLWGQYEFVLTDSGNVTSFRIF